jgi:YfdX protein
MLANDDTIVRIVVMSLTVCLGMASVVRSQQQSRGSSEPSRSNTQTKGQQSIDQQRQQVEQQAKSRLDQEAIAAIMETNNAVKAIEAGRTDEALAALERATGKIDILVARNPAAALIPAAVQVDVIDTAPTDLEMIQHLAGAVEDAVDEKDFPAARVVLFGLMSEIRARTFNLPLATYPIAMQEAVRLLDAQKTAEAKAVLKTALNTLVIVERVVPLPVVTAQSAINEAQALRDSDKEMAQQFLAVARTELERAKELGYAGEDEEYATLNDAIAKIESQLEGGEDTESAFSRLKDRIAAFFTRQSESEKSSNTSEVAAANTTKRR